MRHRGSDRELDDEERHIIVRAVERAASATRDTMAEQRTHELLSRSAQRSHKDGLLALSQKQDRLAALLRDPRYIVVLVKK